MKKTYDAAERAYLRGDLDEAVRLATILVQTANPRDVWLGLGHEMKAVVHRDHGAHQEALQALLDADEALAVAQPLDRELLGRVNFQIAASFIDLGGADDLMLRHMERARDLLRGSTEYAAWYETAVDTVEEAACGDWCERERRILGRIAELEAQIDELENVRLRGRRRARNTRQNLIVVWVKLVTRLAHLRIEHGDDAAAREAFEDIAELAFVNGGDDPPAFFDAIAPFSFVLQRSALDLSDLLDKVVAKAMEIAERTGIDEHMAAALFIRAVSRKNRDPETALSDAVASVTLSERSAVLSSSIGFREASRFRMDERRHLALTLCMESNRWPEAAELIERSRLQTLPLEGEVRREASGTADLDNELLRLLTSQASRLGVVRGVHVEGSSLSEIDRYAPPSGDSVRLDAVIEAVGGEKCWFWSTWAEMGTLFVVTRSPAGAWQGRTVSPDEDARATMAEIERLYLNAHVLGDEEHLGSALTCHDEEQRLMTAAGNALIPPEIAAVLNAADADVSLVVAGNLLMTVPLPALVVPGSDLRLVETATLRVQPPAHIADSVARRHCAARQRWEVEIAVLDPSGELDNAHHPEIVADLILSHPLRTTERAGVVPATVDNVVAALTGRLRGAGTTATGGIFFYSGHVGSDDDGNSAFALADGLLGAGRFFCPNSASPWRVPEKAIVSACDSGGTAGAGGGEWLGFAGGLLSGGARQVVATAWAIPDLPDTARFDAHLLEAAVQCTDLAQALRGLQIDCLARWRANGGGTDFMPLVWAAFQATGLAA